MLVDVNKELDRLLAADQHDPFQVLGWQVIHRDPPTSVIRAFQPRARAMRLVLGPQRLDMYRMRPEGLFEIVLGSSGPPGDYLLEVTDADRSVRLLQDPYRFPSQLSDFDRHLFHQGTHYELYNHLGAHLQRVSGVDGVLFRLWAPAARRVSVLGNFNDWDGRVHQMRCLGTSGIWELFIPGLREGDPYKFEIKTGDGRVVETADPFEFDAEPRPKTASVVRSLAFEWQDGEWQATRRRGSARCRPLSIQEVHAGFRQGEAAGQGQQPAFRDLAEKLIPHLRETGFTHLLFLPLMGPVGEMPQGDKGGGFFHVTNQDGPPQDLMEFIDRCHRNHIGVILDWAPAAPYSDRVTAGRREAGLLGAVERWYAGPGGSPGGSHRAEAANFLIASLLFWLDKYHVDGIRVEGVTGMLRQGGEADPDRPDCLGARIDPESVEFFRHLNGVVAERFPGAIMIAGQANRFSGPTRELAGGGLGFDFESNPAGMKNVLRYFRTEPQLRKYCHPAVALPRPEGWPDGHEEYSLLALSCREPACRGEGSLLASLPGDEWQQLANLRLLLLLIWCQPGKKLFLLGRELGQLAGRAWRGFDWLTGEGNHHQQLLRFIGELNRLYRQNPCLWQNDYAAAGRKWLARGDAENGIVVFSRHGQETDDHLVCLFNFTLQPRHHYKMGVPVRVRYRQILCSDEERFGGSQVCNPDLKVSFPEAVEESPAHVLVSVPPLGGLILQPVREGNEKG